ncbi:hypothetical protein VHEMI05926 [[Torrubiella] hemipterigena]|uniref:Uncharacterized protein n=1 Tax=[Torrubiella] hemipterigena TaxID=1531966 RepID=A0A0A1TJZ2_9HYPO|nr:hypothetical protein VHEMI05926 [[Torrubiella] hemipterigena]
MTQFNVNCTLPDGVYTFVSAPNVRGTMEIVWGCLSILIICTWSVVHPNVPCQLAARTWREKTRRSILRLWWKIIIFVWNVLAPEWTLGKAWSDYRSVSGAAAGYADMSQIDKVPWTRTHSYFAHMGGFAIKFGNAVSDFGPASVDVEKGNALPDQTAVAPQDKKEPNAEEESFQEIAKKFARQRKRYTEVLEDTSSTSYGQPGWARDAKNLATATTVLNMQDFGYFSSDSEKAIFKTSYEAWWHNVRALEQDIWVVDANQLLLARQMGIIASLPNIHEDDLDDRNKGESFVKIVAILQILWFVVQLISRLASQLPTTQLEIMTFAFAICSALTYYLLLDKPKDCQYSIEIPAARYATPAEMARIALAAPVTFGWTRTTLWIPNNALHYDKDRSSTGSDHVVSAAALSLTVFGAIHCIAWNFAFPSEKEALLWHISSILTAAITPLGLLLAPVFALIFLWRDKAEKSKKFLAVQKWVTNFFILLNVIYIGLVLAARIFVTIEVLRSLAFSPPGIFLETGAQGMPHAS